MRKKMRIVLIAAGALCIAFVILPFLVSCCIQGSTPEKVEKKLRSRYGEKFVAESIGNRWNTGSATLYCHPADDPSVRFKAVYDYSDKSLTDNYISRKMAVKFDRELSETLSDAGFDTSSYSIIWDSGDSSFADCDDVLEYITESGTDSIFTRIAVKETQIASAEDIQNWQDTLWEVSRKYDDIDIVAAVFLIPDELFEDCSEEMKKSAEINKVWLEKHGATADFSTNIMEGSPQRSAEEVFADIKRSSGR